MQTPVVCLGASAGGLQALEAFFAAVSPDTGAAFVVIVHLSPDFESLMPEILGKHTEMPVLGITEGMQIQPDHVYALPAGRDLSLDGDWLHLTVQERGPGAPVNLPIDRFLKSLADARKERSVAVIVSGTGSDGSRGLRAVKDAGGCVLVQEPTEAGFSGMPQAAILSGLVDHVGPVADLADRVLHMRQDWEGGDSDSTADLEGALDGVLQILREQAGSEHRDYRRPMVARRVRRRMALNGILDLDVYQEVLLQQPAELQALRQDLLIGVTSFFRDTHAFEALRDQVVPLLMDVAGDDLTLRIWVAACSTGQEVYSIAMLLLDAMGERRVPMKIFATDVNREALARAGRGLYTASELEDVPRHLVARYFEKVAGGFAVRPELREQVIFAPHDVLVDPPFTKMDLVCCRNLLIYLQPAAQQKVMRSLHFAMRPVTGALFLGGAEVPNGIEGSVVALDERAHLYRWSAPLSMPGPTLPPLDPRRRRRRAPPRVREAVENRRLLELAMDSAGKTAALVTREGRLLDLIADPNHLFRLSRGAPTSELGSLVDPDLYTAFGAAMARLGTTDATVVYSVRGLGEEELRLRLLDVPTEDGHGQILVEIEPAETNLDPVTYDADSTARIQDLEKQVSATRLTLQTTIEELQTTNEEQQATNEELVAANEELQSTNEELQSVNEELFTVNSEFQRKNAELQVVMGDLRNLLESTGIGTLFLDEELRVRRFTAGVERVVRLQAQDIGRPITDFGSPALASVVEDVREVAASGVPRERELRDQTGAWLLMRARPYRTMNERLEGVLVTFVEVTRLKNAEESSRASGRSLRDANRALSLQAERLSGVVDTLRSDLEKPIDALNDLLAVADAAFERGDVEAGRAALAEARACGGAVRADIGEMQASIELQSIDAGREEVSLKAWFEALCRPFQARAEEQGVDFDRVCDQGTVTFARAVGEASLSVLLTNALAHGCTGGRPGIDVSCRVVDGALHLVVSDDGPGLPAELAARFQGPETVDADGSLGLLRNLIQRAGGRLAVRSVPGEGARFEVCLPLAEVSSVAPTLLVEDDALDTRMIQRSLRGEQLVVASSLAAARGLLANQSFSRILLDLSLPDGHGLRLLDSLPGVPGEVPPVVLLTGHSEGVDVEQLPEAVVGVVDKAELESGEFAARIARLTDDA